jgi:positive phototaxis protein PixI
MNGLNFESQPSLTPNNIGEPYLRLQLDKEILAVIGMKYTQNVVVVSANRITPIPNVPDYILGLLYQRSRVFWVVDLPQTLQLSPVNRNLQEYYVAIVKINNLPLGLVVPEIKGVSRISQDKISPPIDSLGSQLIPYLKGCFIQDKEILPILDLEAIIKSPHLLEGC